MAEPGLLRWALLMGLLASAPSCLDEREPAFDPQTDQTCTRCHGDASRAGTALQRSAPPGDLFSSVDTSYPGVGAHAAHVYESPTHGAIPCKECHVVPERTDAPGHADDPGPAEVVFGELAKSGERAPTYSVQARTCVNSACHGDAEPLWTQPRPSDAACGTCHGLPPPPPHPESALCATCHAEVIDAERRFVRPELHVNGRIEQNSEQPCTSCHGSANAAPPQDLKGGTSTTLPGVGAHQVHLAGSARARAVPCGECHVVPKTVADPGHIDLALPAEVRFSGAAVASGAAAVFAAGTCVSTTCHGAAFPSGRPSGGAHTEPSWTQVDGTQATCGSCHALPPPAPHPYPELNPFCSDCHANIARDNVTFLRPELHVDGIVTFDVR